MRILHAIEKAEGGSRTDFSKPFIHFQQFLKRRGIVVVLSDFYEQPEQIVKVVEPLRYRGNEVVLFHILDPNETRAEISRPRAAAGCRRRHRHGSFARLRAQRIQGEDRPAHASRFRIRRRAAGLDYVFMDTVKPLDWDCGIIWRFARGGGKLGFLAPWFLGGLAQSRPAGLRPSAAAVPQKPVPFSFAHVLRAAHAEFDQAPAAEVSAALLAALPFRGSAGAGVRAAVYPFGHYRPRQRRPHHGFRHRQFLQHAAGRPLRQTPKKPRSMQINAMHADDRGQVITFGGAAKLLTDMTQDKQALRAALAAIEPGDDASSYAELSRVLRSTSESLKTDIDGARVHRSAEILLAASFSDAAAGRRHEARCSIRWRSAPVPNWTVENVEAPRRVFDTKKVRTVATIAGYNTPDAARKVTLLANGKPLETKQVKVPANGRATVEFLALDAPYGLTRCEVPHRRRRRISRRTTTGCSRWNAPIPNRRCSCTPMAIR